jgi:hypothetical protein
MANLLRSTTRHATPAPVTAGTSASRPVVRRRRFEWSALGFWLGGVGLGTVGGVLGASFPYTRPVAVVLSILWWSIYLGALGASLGALVGLCLERTPPPPSRGSRRPHSFSDRPAGPGLSVSRSSASASRSRR